ncbi:MAG: hypothetical protein VX951_02910 [Planctomycetota bacterium]|nr:hypothetical protein [Planctomycetota bacterium]
MTQITREHDEYLERILRHQLGRIRRRFLIHGVARVLVMVALATILYYPLDRYLRLPGGVRILLSLGLLTYLGYLIHRFILYPLQRRFTRRDIALAIEEKFPELDQKLISAIQLAKQLESEGTSEEGPRNQSRAMIDKLVADAAEHAAAIPHEELLNARPTTKAWGAAAALLLVVFGFGLSYPDISGVFLQRIFGLDTAYPRDTILVIENPSTSDQTSAEYRVQRDGRNITVTLAAGGDLPVVVRSDGIVPREVLLMVTGGRGLPPSIAMSGRGPRHFKHTFRRISGDFSFHPHGGDDFTGNASIEVHVIHPPRVEMTRTTIEYPAYTRKPPEIQSTGSVEALIGSRLKFEVSATAEVQSAKINFLEAGQELTLQPETIQQGDGQRIVYTGEFPVTRSDRYQISLIGMAGLRNPHPGTFHIVGIPDHPPVGRLITPEDDDLNVALVDSIVPVRIMATDDFGLTSISVIVKANEEDQGQTISMFAADPNALPDSEPVRKQTVLHYVDLVTDSLKEKTQIGESLLLVGKLIDNQAPGPKTKDIGPRQIQLVGETDLLRRVSSHFRRIKEDVEQNLQLMRDRHERLEDILDSVEEGASMARQQLPITTVEVAQGRVKSAAGRIHRELMRAFDFHLFNRLESSVHAVTVLGLYKDFHSQVTGAERFFPEFYQDLAKRRQQHELGAMDKTLDPILRMVGSAYQISEIRAPRALRLLAASRVAESNKDAATALRQAGRDQLAMIKEFENLLSQLDTWNEFQDVITNTRSLLDQQRDIQTRTKNLKGDKGK